jgi:lysophospholipase L1-like esterase
MSFLEKLNTLTQVNVAFMGGSITEAEYGKEEYKDSWAHTVEQYFRRKYNNKMNFLNAGVSGTGSDLGIFRLSRDVLAFKPDLIFIEFAINDLVEIDQNKGKILIDLEGIVRRLIKENPEISIVFLFSAAKDFRNCSELHRVIAQYYNIPCIDLQEDLKREIEAGKYDWQQRFHDDVHPNAAGHEVYAQYICRYLESETERFLGSDVSNKAPLMNYEFRNPHMISWKEAKYQGAWKVYEIGDKRKIESVVNSDNPGDSIEISFTGRCFGLYRQVSTDGGKLKCIIDNKHEYIIDFYDSYEMVSLSRFQVIDLPEGDHCARLTICADKNSSSTGNMVRIGYFLVDNKL